MRYIDVACGSAARFKSKTPYPHVPESPPSALLYILLWSNSPNKIWLEYMFAGCESKWKKRENRTELFMWSRLSGVVSKLIWTISMLSSALAVNIGALPYTRQKLNRSRAYIDVRLPILHVTLLL